MKHLIVMFLLVALGACCPKRTDMLSSDMSKWVSYNTNDVVLSVSENSIYDTIVVDTVTNVIDTRSPECRSWTQDEISAALSDNEKKWTINVSINPTNITFFVEDSNPPSIYKSFYFSKKQMEYNSDNIELLSQYELNGIYYYDVFHIKNETKNFELYYAKSKGIIKYKLYGIIYDVVN